MKIGLIDVDGHNYPNIPLMKISAYHKNRGDEVVWYDAMFTGHCDKVYMSKVFSFTADYQYFIDADEIITGGSGYCISLVNGKEVFDKTKDKIKMIQIVFLLFITTQAKYLRHCMYFDRECKEVASCEFQEMNVCTLIPTKEDKTKYHYQKIFEFYKRLLLMRL